MMPKSSFRTVDPLSTVKRFWASLLLSAGLAAVPGFSASPQEAEEFAVKAQILVKLIPYVRWPEEAKPGGAPLVIAVVGSSPFGDHLDRFIKQNPSVHGRPLKAVYAPQYSEDLHCDLLFICPSHYRQSKSILDQAHGHPILTVADDKRLTMSGVMVSLLVQDDNKVHLVLNRGMAASERLEFSSLLLRMARLVETPRSGP